MSQTQSITINFKGGIISPGYLLDILKAAESCHVKQARFGLRQQLIMDVPERHFTAFSRLCKNIGVDFYTRSNKLPNIVSAYVTADIFTGESWLREGAYKDIFDLFEEAPKLKINICDSNQSFVPFFTGHINWISSASQHFWYLCIRFPKTQKLYHWPELIYTNDIAAVSQQIEQVILTEQENYYDNEFADGNALYKTIKSALSCVSKKVEQPLHLPSFSLPYYEGFNKMGADYWLGIYRRDELFPLAFLKELSAICIKTKAGQLYTTPWKGIIIKGIAAVERKLWDEVLGRYRINVRHAANELNWQVEDSLQEGLQLKRHVIRYFDKQDVRTYGLCFAVQTKISSSMFGCIVIRKCQVKNPNRLKSMERFDILHTHDFNPNSGRLVMFRDSVEKNHIGPYLVSLCKLFYDRKQQFNEEVKQPNIATLPVNKINCCNQMHQCSHCLTIYDAATGEPENNIAAGTLFNQLPEDYACSLCDAPKEAFVKIDGAKLQLKTA